MSDIKSGNDHAEVLTATELLRRNKEYADKYNEEFPSTPLGLYLDGLVMQAVEGARKILDRG